MEQAWMEALVFRSWVHLYLLYDPKCVPNSRAQPRVSVLCKT